MNRLRVFFWTLSCYYHFLQDKIPRSSKIRQDNRSGTTKHKNCQAARQHWTAARQPKHAETLLGAIALTAQAIPPILSNLSVAYGLSIYLSIICLLPAFNRLRCHLARAFVGSDDTLCYRCIRWGLWPPGKERFWGRTPPNCKLQPNRRSYAAVWRIQTRSWVELWQWFRRLPNYFGPCYYCRGRFIAVHGVQLLGDGDKQHSFSAQWLDWCNDVRGWAVTSSRSLLSDAWRPTRHNSLVLVAPCNAQRYVGLSKSNWI